MTAVDSCQVRIVDGELVARVHAASPSPEVIADVADVFAILGDAGRVRLLVALLSADELCVCDLAASADMSESATSHALRLLRVQGVVKVRRSGRMAYYSLLDEHVRVLLNVALEHVTHRTVDA
jgi:DNA-binding transcriptional ArsR family regulator